MVEPAKSEQSLPLTQNAGGKPLMRHLLYLLLLASVSFAQQVGGDNAIIYQDHFDSYAHDHAPVVYDDEPTSTRAKRFYWLSVGVLAGGQAMDMASSYGRNEANGALATPNGTFGASGIGIKAGVVGGLILCGFFARHNPFVLKTLTVGNFIVGGIGAGSAIHNYRVK